MAPAEGAHGIRALDTTPGLIRSGKNSFCAGLRSDRKLVRLSADHRHELFDDGFQRNWRRCIETLGRGQGSQYGLPCSRLIVLLQELLGMSDAEAVELTVVDLRWQMVLDCLWGGQTGMCPGSYWWIFSRTAHPALTWTRRLLERPSNWPGEPRLSTGRSCRRISAWQSIPVRWKAAGRRRRHIICSATPPARSFCVWLTCWAGRRIEWPEKRASSSAGGPALKPPLDTEWSDPNAKDEALNTLVAGNSIHSTRWLRPKVAEELRKPPRKEHLDTLLRFAPKKS